MFLVQSLKPGGALLKHGNRWLDLCTSQPEVHVAHPDHVVELTVQLKEGIAKLIACRKKERRFARHRRQDLRQTSIPIHPPVTPNSPQLTPFDPHLTPINPSVRCAGTAGFGWGHTELVDHQLVLLLALRQLVGGKMTIDEAYRRVMHPQHYRDGALRSLLAAEGERERGLQPAAGQTSMRARGDDVPPGRVRIPGRWWSRRAPS
eukprot:SAG31_NODE_3313_length_4429_cov_1.345958_4_plen_205_part_00